MNLTLDAFIPKLEKLMYDFSCVKADNMYFSQLAAKMRYFKEDDLFQQSNNS